MAATVMTERTRVAVEVARQQLTPLWSLWIAAHPDTRDADGDYVEVCLGAAEPAEEIAKLDYPHPVLVATIVHDELLMMQIGPMPSISARYRMDIPVGKKDTVGDVFRRVRFEGHGEPFGLVFADHRAAVLAMA